MELPSCCPFPAGPTHCRQRHTSSHFHSQAWCALCLPLQLRSSHDTEDEQSLGTTAKTGTLSEWNRRNGAPCSVAVAVRAPDAGCCHRGPACRRRNRGCTARHWCSTVKARTCVCVGEAERAQFTSSAARCTTVLLASSTDDSAHASVGAGGGLLAAWPALVANDDVDGFAATRPVSSRSSEVPPWRQRAASDECSPSALVKGSALAIHRCTTAWSSLRAVRWLVLSIASLIQHTCRVTGSVRTSDGSLVYTLAYLLFRACRARSARNSSTTSRGREPPMAFSNAPHVCAVAEAGGSCPGYGNSLCM